MATINRARQTGSAFTAWKFSTPANTDGLILCQEVSHRSPTPIAGAVEVHPINYLRPTEIIVPRAIQHGEIVLNIIESFSKSIYDQIGLNYGTTKINDLADLFNWMMTSPSAVDRNGSKIELIRVIRDVNPDGAFRMKKFEGARIVDVREDETTRVDTTINPLQVVVWYTKLSDFTGANPTGSKADEVNSDGSVKDAPWGL